MRCRDTSLDASAGPRRPRPAHRSIIVGAALGIGLAGTGLAATPAPARAWTEARVRTVATRLSLPTEGGGAARLTLTIDVAVRRGWLERLDVPGLPAGTGPVPGTPATARVLRGGDDDLEPGGGSALRGPEVSVNEAGTVRLTFPGGRRRAPGRGRIRIHVPLEVPFEVEPSNRPEGARAGEATDPVGRLRLPAWNAGLDLPRMVYEAPYPIAPLSRTGSAEGTGVTVRVEVGTAGLHRVIYDRVHLPRQTPWETGVRIPRDTAPAALRASLSGRPAYGLGATGSRTTAAGDRSVPAKGADGGVAGRALGRGGRPRGMPWPSVLAVALLLGLGVVFGPGGRRAILRPSPGARALAWGKRGWILGSLGLAVAGPALPALPWARGVGWTLLGLAAAGLAAFPAPPAPRWRLPGGDPFDGRTPLGFAVLLAGGLGVTVLAGPPWLEGDGIPDVLASALALAAVPWFATPMFVPAPRTVAPPVAPVVQLRSEASRAAGQRSRAASAR